MQLPDLMTFEPAPRPPREIDRLLDQSRAAEEFKADVRRYIDVGNADYIHIEGYAPRVKVARLLKQVLDHAPDLEIQRVLVRGRSGCSDFSGSVKLETTTETRVFDFVWCCRWRAEEEGWTDYFGFPDQIRAAREYDWRCFQVWEERD